MNPKAQEIGLLTKSFELVGRIEEQLRRDRLIENCLGYEKSNEAEIRSYKEVIEQKTFIRAGKIRRTPFLCYS